MSFGDTLSAQIGHQTELKMFKNHDFSFFKVSYLCSDCFKAPVRFIVSRTGFFLPGQYLQLQIYFCIFVLLVSRGSAPLSV